MKRMKRIITCLLTMAMILQLMSCGNELSPQDDKGKIQTQIDQSITYNPEDAQIAAMDFSVRLFQNTVNPPYESDKIADDNVLIAPTSVLTALAMTANGAKNDTLAQMEEVFGIGCEPLRDYMRTYLENLPNEEKYKLHMANSIWIKDDEDFTVNEDFVEINESFFDANVIEKEFDQKTLREINDWVEDNTDGMIEEVLNEIPEDALMYLINALAFEAELKKSIKLHKSERGSLHLQMGLHRMLNLCIQRKTCI